MSFSVLFVLVSWISVIPCPTRAQGDFENFLFTCFVFIDAILIQVSSVGLKMAVKLGLLIICETNLWSDIMPNFYELASHPFHSDLRRVGAISLHAVLTLSSGGHVKRIKEIRRRIH